MALVGLFKGDKDEDAPPYAWIVEGLRPLATPIDTLFELPGNPRRGDVEAIKRSLERFGQRKPVVVNRADNTVEAGNHTLAAARELGWSHIAAVLVDDDPQEASGYALADNRVGDLGEGYDEHKLAEMLRQVDDDVRAATGYDDDETARLLSQLDGEAPTDEKGPGLGTPVISATLVFDDEQQQQEYQLATRWIRNNVPGDTAAERLVAHLRATCKDPG